MRYKRPMVLAALLIAATAWGYAADAATNKCSQQMSFLCGGPPQQGYDCDEIASADACSSLGDVDQAWDQCINSAVFVAALCQMGCGNDQQCKNQCTNQMNTNIANCDSTYSMVCYDDYSDTWTSTYMQCCAAVGC